MVSMRDEKTKRHRTHTHTYCTISTVANYREFLRCTHFKTLNWSRKAYCARFMVVEKLAVVCCDADAIGNGFDRVGCVTVTGLFISNGCPYGCLNRIVLVRTQFCVSCKLVATRTTHQRFLSIRNCSNFFNSYREAKHFCLFVCVQFRFFRRFVIAFCVYVNGTILVPQ